MARFVQIAMGSASEVDYLLLLAADLEYLSEQDYEGLLLELSRVRRMLTGLYKKLEGPPIIVHKKLQQDYRG